MKISHCGDLHVEEDRYFADTAQCLEWFVEDSIRAKTRTFLLLDGDLTTYKANHQGAEPLGPPSDRDGQSRPGDFGCG